MPPGDTPGRILLRHSAAAEKTTGISCGNAGVKSDWNFRDLESVLGNLLSHLNRCYILAVLGDFLLALDVSGTTTTLRLFTMLLTHGGSELGL
jgi:hypothetical protein